MWFYEEILHFYESCIVWALSGYRDVGIKQLDHFHNSYKTIHTPANACECPSVMCLIRKNVSMECDHSRICIYFS